MSRFRVVLIEHGYSTVEHERRIISAAGGEFIDAGSLPLQEALRFCQEADAILCRRLGITAAMIKEFRRCKILVRYGVGTDNVDVEAATAAGIQGAGTAALQPLHRTERGTERREHPQREQHPPEREPSTRLLEYDASQWIEGEREEDAADRLEQRARHDDRVGRRPHEIRQRRLRVELPVVVDREGEDPRDEVRHRVHQRATAREET